MAYVIQSDLKGLIPDDFVIQALDDNGDGQPDPDVWAAVALAVQETIDDALGSAYRTPFASPAPIVVRESARILVCDLLYRRRGVADAANPWVKPVESVRARLRAIAQGGSIPGLARTLPQPALISEPARTTTKSGRMLV